MLQFPGKKEIRIFAAYAKEDKSAVVRFKKVLKMLQMLEKVLCYDRDISPGREWQQEELERLQAADIILLLVSWDFLTSDYCRSEQLTQAIKRHEAKQATVIPVLLHECPWKDTALKALMPLPKDGKPLNKWSTWSDGLTNVYNGIKEVIEGLQKSPLSQQSQDRKS